MRNIIIALFVITFSTPLFADQAQWVYKSTAFAAAKEIIIGASIKRFCEPCGDTEPKTEVVNSIEVAHLQDNYYALKINHKEVDLAYVYILVDGNWQNLAKMTDFYVEGVSDCFNEDFSKSPDVCFPLNLDLRLKECLRKNPSNLGTADCYRDLTKEWDFRLNGVYTSIFKQLTEKQRADLIAAQRAWIKFRDLEISFYETLYSSLDGSMYIPFLAADIMSVTSTRTKTLMSTLHLLDVNDL